MTTIYESPDKGNTVYSREFGSNKREEIRSGSIGAQLIEAAMWNDIRKSAITNPTLQAALDQCIMIYKLSKDYNNA
jgi:hypothetical protein